jgi:flagellar basal-body rod protein FlgB
MSDSIFGIHGAALSLHARRLEMISGNLANADTPGYRARDLDFQSTLQLMVENAGSKSGNKVNVADAPTFYRTAPASLDGNGVDASREQAAFADAALRYEAALRFVDGRTKSLMTAITGQ